MTALLVALVALNAAWLWFTFKDRQAERRERGLLLNRIQAPQETVALQLAESVGPSLPHVPLDDDAEFQKARLEAIS